jgi:hypothetical protein
MKRRYFRWGVCCALIVLSCFVIAIAVQIAFSFKGQCGGLMPFLAGPRPCSFWEYFSGQALFVLLIVRETYWLFVLLLLIVPISVGYLLDRLQNRAP